MFNVADNAGTTRHFVFDTDSDTVDGTTVEIDEVPHVVVGIASAGNDTTAIANQMEKAINNAGGAGLRQRQQRMRSTFLWV